MASLSFFTTNAPKNFIIGYNNYFSTDSNIALHQFWSTLKTNGVNTKAFYNHNFFAKQKKSSKNLILIYLESLEESYFDENKFPGLTPNIKTAMQKGLQFTNMKQMAGADFTMGGLFASQCGLPLLTNVHGNDAMSVSNSYSYIACLGNVLEKIGYYNVFMGGASINFGGKGTFFRKHGYDEILGINELNKYNKDKKYKSGWGLYDDTLFDLAYNKIIQISKKNQKFAFTLLTIDTHHPFGNASKSCPKYKNSTNSMLQAVFCTDYLFGKFLNNLTSLPFFKDTLIFVMSDHLALRNVAMSMYPPKRKNLLFVLNSDLKPQKFTSQGTHFDIPETILSLLNINTDYKTPFGGDLTNNPQKNRFSIFDDKNNFTKLREIIKGLDKPYNLCGKYGIEVNSSNFLISLGSKMQQFLFQGGQRLPGKGTIFVAQTDLNGIIKHSSLMYEEESITFLKKNINDYFFTISTGKRLPYKLSLKNIDPKKWLWFIGSPYSSKPRIYGVVENLDDIKITPKHCKKIYKQNKFKF